MYTNLRHVFQSLAPITENDWTEFEPLLKT